MLQDSMKKKELKAVDHNKIDYITVRKNLYIIPKALVAATEQEARMPILQTKPSGFHIYCGCFSRIRDSSVLSNAYHHIDTVSVLFSTLFAPRQLRMIRKPSPSTTSSANRVFGGAGPSRPPPKSQSQRRVAKSKILKQSYLRSRAVGVTWFVFKPTRLCVFH